MTARIPAKHLRLKRVYEPAAPEDGVRVLIDRLWPRGLTKKMAAIDHWMNGHRSELGVTQMVRPRPRSLDRIPEPLHGGVATAYGFAGSDS
jgi:hypothetical protein